MPPQTVENVTKTHTNKVKGDIPLSSGFQKYPSKREYFFQNSEIWLRGKREDDGVYPYWRVHDKLYDLTDFVSSHPGGKFWIEINQGTDITELFESSHFGEKPQQILKKYFVKDTSVPRNSPFTFKDDGFFRTLKRKVIPIIKEVGTGPNLEMILIQDSLLYGFLFFLLAASLFNSFRLIVVAGCLLSLTTIASHNFFHKKDNWRMYIFDMMLFSSREWRISHVISHHIFPNTIYDYEISSFEPSIDTLPRLNKSFMQRYGIIVTGYLVYAMAFYLAMFNKIVLLIKGEVKLQWANLIPFVQLFIMMTLNESAKQGLWLWLVMHALSSLVFLLIGLTAAHHHPDIYHEGDVPPDEKDWGIHQISATRERGEVMSSLFLVAVTFGNHTLHHLFPTVDHSKLPHLINPFLETCAEFGIKFQVFTTWQLFKGFFQQMATTRPNSNYPKCLQNKNY